MTIQSVAGRHFFGHGVFSPDGALLYATENDFDNAAGMVGIYDARSGFARIGEFPTHGVGPHELLLLGDGRTIAIANGGIETHPDFGRAKLNLPTMKPSFVLVDRANRRPDREARTAARACTSCRSATWTSTRRARSGSAASTKVPATERPALVGTRRARQGA